MLLQKEFTNCALTKEQDKAMHAAIMDLIPFAKSTDIVIGEIITAVSNHPNGRYILGKFTHALFYDFAFDPDTLVGYMMTTDENDDEHIVLFYKDYVGTPYGTLAETIIAVNYKLD